MNAWIWSLVIGKEAEKRDWDWEKSLVISHRSLVISKEVEERGREKRLRKGEKEKGDRRQSGR